MGQVFSCLASACACVGELLENVCLALGEVAAVLVRGVVGLLVGLLDLLAALACCWRVPWSQRPTGTMLVLPATPESNLESVGGKRVLYSLFARQERKTAKAAKSQGVQTVTEKTDSP